MNRKNSYLLAGGLGIALALAGCSGGGSTPGGDDAGDGGTGASGKLVIATWGGAFTEATQQNLVEAFTAETGIEVQIVDAPGTQAAQMQSMVDAGDVQWDILDALSAADAYFMNSQDLLEPLEGELRDAVVEQVGEDRVSDFGFSFANLGYVVICNMDAVEACPETVADFFDTEKFPGNRMYPGESYGPSSAVLLEALGKDADEVEIGELADELRLIKDSVSVWWTSGDQQDQALRQGEADMAIARSGRAYTLVDEGLNIQVNWAGIYDPGFTAIAKDAPNRENADLYMEWLAGNAEAQAGFAEQIQYSVPNPRAFDLMDPKVAERLADYPANFEKLGQQDFDWYLQNKTEIDEALRSVIQG